ncbi:hypothetical protein PCASD_23587 [Puccinia coronata f. sp. avenae]|uniref:Uncharacterized protein n=1 Tax=Puccinia coronata f. sp. avenae TaxID=200324 RepID=A0A2N5TUZ8_9BASI|nr:hypothetical protein PCASD_23587 [Puccinia coronata f. sp. avenae]
MLVIQEGLPNHVELPERSGRLQSPWRKVLGGPAASARRPMPASQKNTVRNTRMAGTAAANRNLIARPQAQQAAGKSQDSATFHLHIGLLQLPASSIPPIGQDKGEPVTRGDSLPQTVLGRLGGRTRLFLPRPSYGAREKS